MVTRAPAEPLEVDVAIVGGGLVGASLAAGLAATEQRVLLVESVPFTSDIQPSFDERTTALGNASRRILEGVGVWPAVAGEAAAIRAIHVSEAGRFGFARLTATEQGIDAFGYVVANRSLGAALWQRLAAAPNLRLEVPGHVADLRITAEAVRFTAASESGARREVAARLVVGADGAQSQIRSAAGSAAEVEDYGQVAVVATVLAEGAPAGCAYERFTATGPLAVLPMSGGRLAVIWACQPERARELLALSEPAYLAQLQSEFGWRAGRFVRAGRRSAYPLKLTRAASTTAQRLVLIGNAAQSLHPVAGQGFNLGLRDAAMLAEVIAAAAGDPGGPEVLRRFEAWRARDRAAVVRFTDTLVRLFADRRPGVALLRNLGLLLFDLAPPAKSALARIASGFGGPSPRLARGLPLRDV